MGVIVMGKIESGCCRVGDRCVLMPNRTRVEVTNIYYEEIETDSCVCGEKCATETEECGRRGEFDQGERLSSDDIHVPL